MTSIHERLKRIAFIGVMVVLSGIILLGLPNPVSAQRHVAPYYSHGGGFHQPYYTHGGGYGSYRGSGHGGGYGFWWAPLAIVGGAVAVLTNTVAVLSNSVAQLSNYNSPYYAPNYAAPPVYVQPAPSVPPRGFVYIYPR